MAAGKARAGKRTKPTIPDDVRAGLVERGKETPGFDAEDKSTWPDFYWKEGRPTPRQLQESDKRYDRHPDFAAQTKRWGRAMRKLEKGIDPAKHEGILDDAKKRAARMVQADLRGELKKELLPGATRSDVSAFTERFKASVVGDTHREFLPRLDKDIVGFGEFETAIWEEQNHNLKGTFSLMEYVNARVQEFVAGLPTPEVIAAAVTQAAIVEIVPVAVETSPAEAEGGARKTKPKIKAPQPGWIPERWGIIEAYLIECVGFRR